MGRFCTTLAVVLPLVVLLLESTASVFQTGMTQTVSRRINRAAVTSLAQKLSTEFDRLRCDLLKVGTGCQTAGLHQKWTDMAEKIYKTEDLSVLNDLLANPDKNFGLLPQISGVFSDASDMLILLRVNLEKLIITQHRISQLTPQNYSRLPEWDATNPIFKANTNPMLEGKNFTKPVLKQSTLRYPKFVSKSDRTVQIAANASEGLDTFFVSNLINPKYSFLRWQRFVSFTGLTRQFPAMYDPGLQDDRLTSWYNMATQVPKRALFLLDVSPSMKESFELAKNVITTLLATLIPEDLANVIIMDDQTSSPRCFQNNRAAYLVPANPSNVQELRNFVASASIGKFQSSIYESISAAIAIFQATEQLVSPSEQKKANNPKQCFGYRCAPINEYLFVVTDGNFFVANDLYDGLQRFKQQRSTLQLFGLAVGTAVNLQPIQLLTCGMNGKLVTLEPPSNEQGRGPDIKYESYILNEMKEYFQMVAAPLARNRSQLQDSSLFIDVTWSLPQNPYGSEIMITLALPCFGDVYSDSPSLLGVVSVDLVWLKPGDEVGDGLISYWKNVVLPPIAGLDYFVVFTKGYRGMTLLDKNLVDSYNSYLTSLEGYPSNGIRHYLWTDFIESGIEGSDIQAEVFGKSNGTVSFTQQMKARTNWDGWMFESFNTFLEKATLTWVRVPGHPIVVILRVKETIAPGKNISYTPADRDLVKVCKDCWSFPNRNIMTSLFTNDSEAQSWLYIPIVGYSDSVTYLKQDLRELPPVCFLPNTSSGSSPNFNTSKCSMQRMNNLMRALNANDFSTPAAYFCGSGLLKQTKDQIFLTSVVDFLWNDTFSRTTNLEYVNRLFVATPIGIFRTRGHPNNRPIVLPKLYEPTFDPWYLRAVSSTGWRKAILTPPTTSIFDVEKQELILTMSARIRQSYIPSARTDDSTSDLAAVVGAELNYSKIHEHIYGISAFRGISAQSNFQCSSTTRCYIIDDNAVVIMHPEFGSSQEFWQHLSAKEAIFLGSIEPTLMQLFVEIQFMVQTGKRDVTVTSATYWGELKTWIANASLVPFRQNHGLGNVIVDLIPNTNSYLIVLDNYRSPQAVSGCGVISDVCSKVFSPSIVDSVEDICLLQYDRVASNFRKASDIPLLQSFDMARIIASLQLFDNCPSPFSDWIWQLFVAGVAFLIGVALLLSAQKFLYVRKRNQWILQSSRETSDIKDFLVASLEGLAGRKQKIVQQMLLVSEFLSNARDFDDFKHSIQVLCDLFKDIATMKELFQDEEENNLESLAIAIGKMLLAAQNLKDRLQAYHHSRETRGNIKTGLDHLQQELARVTEKISTSTSTPGVRICSSKQADSADKRLEQEEKFYTSFYPHVFKFENESNVQNEVPPWHSNLPETMTPRSMTADQTDLSCVTESLREFKPEMNLKSAQPNLR